MLRFVPSRPTLMGLEGTNFVKYLLLKILFNFVMNGCWILSNAFYASIEMLMWIFFSFVNVVYHIDWLAYVEPSLWPWDKSILIVMILLIFVDLVCYYLLRIFASVFIEDTGLWFSFLVASLFCLDIRTIVAL